MNSKAFNNLPWQEEQGSGSGWEIPLAAVEDAAFSGRVESVFTAIYGRWFADELMLVNHALPIQVRALRRIDIWRVFLLLTPWMLTRVLAPVRQPTIALPRGWRGAERRDAPYTVIGPSVSIPILGTSDRAHVNYDPRLGHHLLQPLVQSMERFESAHAVYAAWNQVIQTRDDNIRKLNKECLWQQDVSRREFFSRLASPRA